MSDARSRSLYPRETTEEIALAALRPDDTVLIVDERGVVYHVAADHAVVAMPDGSHRRVDGAVFYKVVLAI